jgi:hypothetical protein
VLRVCSTRRTERRCRNLFGDDHHSIRARLSLGEAAFARWGAGHVGNDKERMFSVRGKYTSIYLYILERWSNKCVAVSLGGCVHTTGSMGALLTGETLQRLCSRAGVSSRVNGGGSFLRLFG